MCYLNLAVVVVYPGTRTTSPPATPPSSNCTDTVDNCADYGSDICHDYVAWSKAHCARSCGFCEGKVHVTFDHYCYSMVSNCIRVKW